MDGWTGLLNWKRGPMTKKKEEGRLWQSDQLLTSPTYLQRGHFLLRVNPIEWPKKTQLSDGPKLVQRPSVSLPKHMNRFYKFFLSLCTEKVEY
jgi:hypothetical protein